MPRFQRDFPSLRETIALARHLLTPAEGAIAGHDLLPQPHRDVAIRLTLSALAHVQPELRNAERIPRQGRAILVGNHALMGIDSFALFPLLLRETGRLPRGLADTFLARKAPVVRTFLHRAGVVEASPGNAMAWLERDELVMVYPGGAGESFKGPDTHYRLHWDRRKGFIRLSMRAQAPIVPILGAGIDHAYRYLFHERLITRLLVGKDDARYDFPISLGLGPLPLPGRFTFHVGEPIPPPPDPKAADDPAAVDAHHALVWRTAQDRLDEAMRIWRAEQAPAAATPGSRGEVP